MFLTYCLLKVRYLYFSSKNLTLCDFTEYSLTRIRIRIGLAPWIRILIEIRSWIRIRIPIEINADPQR
jgi:hypothetical protein